MWLIRLAWLEFWWWSAKEVFDCVRLTQASPITIDSCVGR